jgi:aminoglycoside phosphotransferase (APT) family kinase protein
MDREIWAHTQIVPPLADASLAPRLLHAEPRLRLVATTFLPGLLVEGTPAEHRPDVYRRAGTVLALLHAQGRRPGDDHERCADARALDWLEREHCIADELVDRLRAELAQPVPSRPVVPTHGDWQPRNWLVDDGRLAVIDFGRADWRPAATDLGRLHAQQFRGRPDLEQAFLDGYGSDPREAVAWRRDRLRDAVGTAVWAHLMGQEEFERVGLRMIADVLTDR